MVRAPLLLAAFLLAGCGRPLLEATATVCQHLPAQRFELPAGVAQQYAQLPPGRRPGLALERTFDFAVSAQLPPELQAMTESHFVLTSVRLTALEAEADLGFIDEAHVQLQPGAASGLEARVFDYARTQDAPRIISWSGAAFDVAAWVEAGHLKYTVTAMVSSPPSREVRVDLDACAAVWVKLDSL